MYKCTASTDVCARAFIVLTIVQINIFSTPNPMYMYDKRLYHFTGYQLYVKRSVFHPNIARLISLKERQSVWIGV